MTTTRALAADAPRTVRRLAVGVLAVGLLALTTACGGSGDDDADGGASATAAARVPASAAADATADATQEVTEEPTEDEATESPELTAPATVLAAGAVADGAPAVVSGAGPATVTYSRQGEIAVTAALDCSACTGEVVISASDRGGEPWGEGPAPFTGTYLLDIMTSTAADRDVWVVAEGPWTLTLASWNELPPITGPQSGTGSAVLYLSEAGSGFDVSYTPVGEGDSVSIRAYSDVASTDSGPDSRLLGDTEAFTESVDLPLPGVVAITTNGSWTLTPRP
ncbi:hypothetical protein [Miniimonas sp. S16]|uniref:hypothetical protein n=1 Tax=Miniimonas sp. S16 TaxID=2171623 RepID=UPI000D5272B2|nr:hypothetical protein [Miniimonas sp. S16]